MVFMFVCIVTALLLLVYFSRFTSAARAYVAQVVGPGIGDKVANTASANESDVPLHGKRLGAVRYAGAEYNTVVKAVYTEKTLRSDSAYKSRSPRLILIR